MPAELVQAVCVNILKSSHPKKPLAFRIESGPRQTIAQPCGSDIANERQAATGIGKYGGKGFHTR